MNLNFIRVGIITAAVSLVAIAPSVTWAGTPAPAPTTTTDVQPIPGKIQLTKEQLQKINAIRSDRNKKIVAVLTPEQRTKFGDALKDEQKFKPALLSLNLTNEQKTKIIAIGKKSAEEMVAVLTPQQRKQLQELQAQNKKK